MDKYYGFFRAIGQIASALFISLIVWNWYTLNEHEKTLVQHTEQLKYLKEETKEIVPRSENERRYTGIEMNINRNYEALQSLQQSCYQAISRVEKQ